MRTLGKNSSNVTLFESRLFEPFFVFTLELQICERLLYLQRNKSFQYIVQLVFMNYCLESLNNAFVHTSLFSLFLLLKGF